MRELYQCVCCGWLTVRIRLLTPTGDGLQCKHCIDRRDGFYAPACPVHDDDGNLHAAKGQEG